MIKWNKTPYPSTFIRLSDELAKVRSKLSKDVYKEGTDKFRGNQEHSISQLGILGELIARYIMDSKKMNYTEAPLIDLNPVVEADIVIHNDFGDDFFVDVKGVKSDAKHLRVNYNSHNNPRKNVTHYLFIQTIDSTEARYCWATRKVVDVWDVEKSTYTDCYQVEIK